MQSIKYIPASNGTANPSLMTVQTLRAAGATTIITNTVSGVPGFFYATMGTPHTFTDPQTGETITIISEATAVDFAGHTNSGQIIIDAIAPGYADTNGSKVGDIVVLRPITEWANNIFNILSQSHNDDGSLKASAIIYNPNISDYIQSGGVWSALTGLNATMTALVGWQAGYKNTLAAVTTRAFTASKDTYVDVLRDTTTNAFSIVYTEVTNNAASPALAINSIRLAKVVTSGAAITTIVQTGDDAVGNIIYPIGASISSKNIQNPHKFSVYRNAAWSLPSASGVYPVLFDTKEYDTGTNYNTATGLFTAPVAGFYKFDAYTNTTITSGDTLTASLVKNGVLYKYGITVINNSGFNQPGSSVVSPPPILLAAGDTIGIQITHAASYAAGGAVGAANTYFGGSLVNRV